MTVAPTGPGYPGYPGYPDETAEELYDQAPCGYLATSPDGLVVKVNQTFLRWTGYTREDLVGRRRFQDLLSPGGRIYHETHCAPLLRVEGSVREIALVVMRADSTRLDVLVSSTLVTDTQGHARSIRTTVFDATERRRYESELLRSRQQAQAAARRSDFLLQAASALATTTDFEEMLGALAAVAVPTLADLCFIDVVDDRGRLQRRAGRHADPARQHLVDELRRRYPPRPGPEDPGWVAARDREVQWSTDLPRPLLDRVTHDDTHAQLLLDLGARSYIVVPLVAHGDVVGVLSLVSTRDERAFNRADVALAEEFADQVAMVIASAQQYDEERRMAHALQAALLPRVDSGRTGLEVAVRYLPGTRNAEVGGDYYDLLALPDGKVALAVGDVVGHDMAAAAVMGQLRSATRALIADASGPSDLVERLQARWELLDLDRMATAVHAWLDPVTGELAVSSAGHLPPLLLDASEVTYLPVPRAPLLGLRATPAAPEWRGTLRPGATLLLFTDGLVERRDRSISRGLDDLAGAVRDLAHLPPAELCDGVLTAVLGEQRTDDVALLAVRRPG